MRVRRCCFNRFARLLGPYPQVPYLTKSHIELIHYIKLTDTRLVICVFALQSVLLFTRIYHGVHSGRHSCNYDMELSSALEAYESQGMWYTMSITPSAFRLSGHSELLKNSSYAKAIDIVQRVTIFHVLLGHWYGIRKCMASTNYILFMVIPGPRIYRTGDRWCKVESSFFQCPRA